MNRIAASGLERKGELADANAAAAAYHEIKRCIVELQYSPGERLSESRLVLELGCGRSPIRTALARLKSEGWIAVSPQSGTFVKALTNREIEEVAELRELLEVHAIQIATRQMSDRELMKLHLTFGSYAPEVARGDADAFIELDKQVHVAIYRAAGNELVFDILMNLRDKVQWIRRACAVSNDRVQDGFAELKLVFEALKTRRAEEAAECMRVHIRNAAAFCRTVEQNRLQMSDIKQATRRSKENI
ncbi:MAG: GntR family transcriptional regulator [Methylobacteriaceae bacterium]|nr:GntR family transcriptional regulator [Methylobacteriaceae bacterium]